ncbi:unnamed protein product, partial [Mesorhabditis spiculigera]
MDESSCVSIAAPIAQFLPIRLMLMVQVFFSMTAAVQSIYTIKKYAKAYFHVNCKLLVILLLSLFILMGISVSITLTYHVILLSLPIGCQTLVPPWQCFLMRGFGNLCTFTYTPVHFAITMERFAARYFGARYEEMGCGIGVMLANVAVSIYRIVLSNEHWDASNSVPYCSIGNQYTAQNASNCMMVLLGIDIIGLVLMGFSYWKELRAEQRTFDVQRRFSSMERRDANALLFPFSALHTTMYLVYEVAFVVTAQLLVRVLDPLTYKALFISINFTPYYAVASNLMLVRLLNRMRAVKRRKWDDNFRVFNDHPASHSIYMTGCFTYTPVHFAITMERFAARYFGAKYEEMGCGIGAMLAHLAIIAGLGIYGIVISNEHWDASNAVPYCSIGNQYTSQNASSCMMALLGIDMIGLVLMGFSYWREFKAEQRTYDVQRRFSSIERRDANALLLPFSAMHTAMYLVYEVAFVFATQFLIKGLEGPTYKAVFISINFTPYYAVASNLMLVRLLNRMRATKRQKWADNFRVFNDHPTSHQIYMSGW